MEGCTNPQCKARKCSSHKTSDCYWPGGGKEGQFPTNFGQRTRANITTSNSTTSSTPTPTTTATPGQTEHFVLLAQISSTPGQSGVVIDNPSDDDADPDFPHKALISKGFQNFEKGKIPTFLDSGASDTMFVLREAFAEYKSVDSRVGDSAKAKGGDFEIIGEGDVIQRYVVDGNERKITYTRALHTPTLNANLISVGALDKAGLITTFGNSKGVTTKPDGTVILAGMNVNGMYLLETLSGPSQIPLALSSLSQSTSLEQWHRRFTHCSPLTIKDMANNNMVDGLKLVGDTLDGKCEDCIMGRQTRRPFDGESEKTLAPLDLVSFDLWGPSRTQSASGKLYLMIVVDAGTSYKYGAYLANKSDTTTLLAFEVFRTNAEVATGKKLRCLRTDGAFETSAWKSYCQEKGITHEFTAPYSSSQNGLAERAIRTTIDDIRTLLRDSGLPHSYWAEAAAYSIYTRNLIPSCRIPGRIPKESFTGKRQDVSHLRVFGSKCWAKIPTVHGQQVTGGSKLDPRSAECRFLGYAIGTSNYKVQDTVTHRTFTSREVVFEEGRPHRTLTSVGEKTQTQIPIPLFDADALPPIPLDNVPTAPKTDPAPAINDPTPAINDHAPAINGLDNIIDQPPPVIPVEQRRSSRAPQPSNTGLQSLEYRQREVTGKIDGQEWATDQRRP